MDLVWSAIQIAECISFLAVDLILRTGTSPTSDALIPADDGIVVVCAGVSDTFGRIVVR
jgi:ABC-type uncharacterized transport system substrate-binding protein